MINYTFIIILTIKQVIESFPVTVRSDITRGTDNAAKTGKHESHTSLIC